MLREPQTVGNGRRFAHQPPDTAPETAWAHAQRGLGKLEDLIAEKPLIALTAAITLGIILGWWVKRR